MSGNWRYITHYFACTITGRVPRRLTAEEEKTGLEPRWLPMEEAMAMFCRYADHAAEPMKLGAYRREFTAMSAWLAQRRNEDALEHEKRHPLRR